MEYVVCLSPYCTTPPLPPHPPTLLTVESKYGPQERTESNGIEEWKC